MAKQRHKNQPKLASKLEDKVQALFRNRHIKALYEPDKLPYVIPAATRKYIPDFRLPNGIYVEVKGRLDAPTKRKMLWVKEQNPGVDIRFVFRVNNYLTNSRKTGVSGKRWRYSDWARIHGFPCCFMEPGKTAKQDKTWEEIVIEWSNEKK